VGKPCSGGSFFSKEQYMPKKPPHATLADADATLRGLVANWREQAAEYRGAANGDKKALIQETASTLEACADELEQTLGGVPYVVDIEEYVRKLGGTIDREQIKAIMVSVMRPGHPTAREIAKLVIEDQRR
jgi:hypothetical protein